MPRMTDEGDSYYALGRVPRRVYFSRRFPLGGRSSDDVSGTVLGEPARFAYQIYDPEEDVRLDEDNGHEILLRETSVHRQQVKALFFEDNRKIARLVFQRFLKDGRPSRQDVFTLSGSEIASLTGFLDLIQRVALPEEGYRIDEETLKAVLDAPESREKVYEDNPEAMFRIIEKDADARDVVALQRRREQLHVFEKLLNDRDYFEQIKHEWAKRQDEGVWQRFFDENRWIFGFGLSPQVLLSWDLDRLEAVVGGYSVGSFGKRTDALMRTSGALSSLCFVEIKLPTTQLLSNTPYRSGAWGVSQDVSGGIAQCQATVERARKELGERLVSRDQEGYSTDLISYLCRPRSYLIVGSLEQFLSTSNQPNEPQFRSFENYRRSVSDPEIVTFDELYQRACLLTEAV